MNDVDKYLANDDMNPMTFSFDILAWWKDNYVKYKVSSLIARDVLVIPISTMALESTFSIGGWILDSFRSSYLSPKTVEALVCTQNWLKSTHDGITLMEYVDEVRAYEFIETGLIFSLFLIFSYYNSALKFDFFCFEM